MNEWKSIKGYEGLYSINESGEVRRDRGVSVRVINGKPRNYPHKEMLLKGDLNSSGYLRINLHNGGESKRFFIHRLVAIHFIDKVDGKEFVNHIDGVKTNNESSNLEWVTPSENNLHALHDLGYKPNTSGINPKRRVNQIDKQTKKVIETFDSISQAHEATNVLHISSVCRGKRITAGGYMWEYAD